MDYIVKFSGDISGLEKAIKKADGQIHKVADNKVVVSLDYNGNIKEFNKIIQNIINQVPELSIQFQYDINKQLLEREMNKLKNLEQVQIDVDTNQFQSKIKSMTNEIEKAFDNDFGAEQMSGMITDLFKYIQLVKDLGGEIKKTNIDKITDTLMYNSEGYGDVEKTVEELIESFKKGDRVFKSLNYSDDISKEMKIVKDNIQDLNQYMTDLISKGASDGTGGGKDFGKGFVEGIKDSIPLITNAIKEVGQTIVDKLSEFNSAIKESGEEAGSEYAKGFNSNVSISDSNANHVENVNIDKQSADFQELLQVINKISSSIDIFVKTLGEVDSEKNSIISIVDAFERLLSVLQEIQPKVGTGVFNIDMSSNDTKDIDAVWRKQLKRYENAYDKISDIGKKSGWDADATFTKLYTSLVDARVGITPHLSEFENLYSPSAISGLSTAEEKIRRIIDLIGFIKDASKSTSDPFIDDLVNKIKFPAANFQTIERNLKKAGESLDAKTLEDSLGKLNDETDEVKVDLSDIIVEVRDLHDTLIHISENVDFADLFEKALEPIEELRGAFEAIREDILKITSVFDEISKSNIFGSENTSNNFNAENETNFLLQLQNKLREVTDDIGLKSNAFIEEQDIVGRTVSNEVGDLNTLQNKLREITEDIGLNSNAFIEEQDIVGKTVSNEVGDLARMSQEIKEIPNTITITPHVSTIDEGELNSLNSLKEILLEIIELIDKKTQSFMDEEELVKLIMDGEVKNVGRLYSSLSIIKDILDELNKIFKGSKLGFVNSLDKLVSVISNTDTQGIKTKLDGLKDGCSEFVNELNSLKLSDDNVIKQLNELIADADKLEDLKDILKNARKGLNNFPNNPNNPNNNPSGGSNHGGASPFLDPVIDKDEWDWAIQKADQYRDVLGEIAKVERVVKGDKISYNIIGDSGNKINVARNSDDEWTTSNQILDSNKASKEVNKIKNTINKALDSLNDFQSGINSTGKNYNGIEKINDDIDNLRINLADIATTVNENNYDVLGAKLDNQLADKERIQNEYKDLAKSSEEVSKRIDNIRNSANNTLKSVENFQTKIKSTGKNYSGFEEINNSIDELKANLENVAKTVDETNYEKLEADLDTYLARRKEIQAEYGNMVKDPELKPVKASEITKEMQRLQTFMSKNDGASKDWLDSLRSCYDVLEQLGKQAKVTAGEFEPVKAEINRIEAAMVEAGEGGRSMFTRIAKSIKSQVVQQVAMYFSFQDLIRYGREFVNVVREIDSGLTELRKVSNETDNRLSLSFENSTKTAKELGSSISNVIASTADWSRLGYNIDQAEELARVTTLYQNVGDNIDQETASQSLVSTLQGFKMDAENAIDIVDKFNEVANNYAIDSRGIGEALQRSAASFNAAHTGLSSSIALITATNEVLQDPEKVGNMWRTISARIRGAKAELEELGEDVSDVTSSTSKLQGLVKGLTGFDIMEDANNFKDLDEIIIGIGEHWNDLEDIQKASLLEALAGKVQSNALAAVLNNIETVKAAYETAENSAGSAMREQGNYEKSIQYSLDRLAASAQEFATTFLSSGFVKGIVDIGNGFINAATAVDSFAGSLNTVLGLGSGALSFFKNVGIAQLLKPSSNSEYIPTANIEYGAGGRIKVSAEQFKYMLQYNQEFVKNDGNVKEFIKNHQDMADSLKNVSGITGQSTYDLKQFTTSSKAAALSTTLLNTALNTLIGFGIGIAINIFTTLFDHIANASKYAEDALDSTIDKIQELESNAQNSQKWIDQNAKKFVELSKGVDTLGHNISLTDEEYKTYISLSNEASDLFPDMVKGYNSLGDAIIYAKDGLISFNENQDKVNETLRAQRAQSFTSNWDNFWSGETTSGDKRSFLFQDYQDLNNALNGGELTNNIIDYMRAQLDPQDNLFFDNLLTNAEAYTSKTLDGLKEAVDRFYTGDTHEMGLRIINGIYAGIRDGIKTVDADLNNSDEAKELRKDLVAKALGANSELSSDQKDLVANSVGSIPLTFLESLEKQEVNLDKWIDDYIIKPIKEGLNGEDFPSLMNQITTLSPEDEKSYSDYILKLDTLIQKIATLLGLPTNSPLLKGLLGGQIEESDTGHARLETAYKKFGIHSNSATAGMGSSFSEEKENYINSLSSEELEYINSEAVQSTASLAQLKAAVNDFNRESATTTKTFKELWNELGKDEKTKEARTKLLEMAKSGQLSVEAFEKFKQGKYADMFKDIGLSAEEAVEKINKLAPSVTQLSSMKTGISAILSAYDEKRDSKDKRVGADTLSNLGDTLGVKKWNKENKKVWDSYQKTAASGKTTLKQLKKAQDDLATSYVASSNFMENLDKDHKQYYIDLLSEMGVTNATEVVTNSLKNKTYELMVAKVQLAVSNREVTDSSSTTLKSLAEEAKQLGLTGKAAAIYKAEIIKASGVTLMTDGSIKNLKALGRAIGIQSKDLAEYANIMWKINQIQSGKAPAGAANELPSLLKRAKKMEDSANKIKVEVNTNGGSVDPKTSSNSKSDNDTKKQKANKQYIDWIERRITRINNIIENISSKIENIGKWIPKIARTKTNWTKGISDALDKARVEETNKAIEKQIKYYRNLWKVQDTAEKKYAKTANAYYEGGVVGYSANGKAIKVKKNKSIKGLIGKKNAANVIKKIQSGGVTKKLLKQWRNQYGEKAYEAITNYIDFYDKSQSANQSKEDTAKTIREKRVEENQNWADLYESRVSRAEAYEQIRIGRNEQNKSVRTQLKNLEQSYKYQIEIAKLNKSQAEIDRLKYEWEEKRRELLYKEVENIKNDFENLRGLQNNRIQDAQNLLDVTEAEGRRVDTGLYTVMNNNNRELLDSYNQERAELIEKLDGMVKGSSQYYDTLADIQEVENSIAQTQATIANNNTSIRKIISDTYDEIRNNNTKASDRLNTIIGLMRGDVIDTSTKGGSSYYRLTDVGRARLAGGVTSLASAQANYNTLVGENGQYSTLKKDLDDYKSGVLSANQIITKYNANSIKDLETMADELYDKVLEAKKAEYEAQQTLIDLMTEYYEGQKAYLQEIIDAKKKILDEDKDLYDYEKTINEKTKNIATIQKQLAALQGDNSEEGLMRRQRLQADLDSAQQDLQDTEYDRWKSDQEAMLDNLIVQHEDIINKHLKDTDALISEGSKIAKDNGDSIRESIQKLNIPLDGTISDITTSIGNGVDKLVQVLNTHNATLTQYIDSSIERAKTDATVPDVKNNAEGEGKGLPEPEYSKENDAGDSGKKVYVDRELLKRGIKQAGTTPKKDYSKYSDLNKAIYDFSKKYLGQPLIIHDDYALTKFASAIGGLKFLDDENVWKKGSDFYNYLRAIGGFKTGGIGKLVKANGEDGIAMVRNGEGFVQPEHVSAIQNLLKIVPDMSNLASVSKFSQASNVTVGDLNISLPDVQDPRGFVEAFQNNKEVQRIFKIGVEDIVKGGRISNRIHSV